MIVQLLGEFKYKLGLVWKITKYLLYAEAAIMCLLIYLFDDGDGKMAEFFLDTEYLIMSNRSALVKALMSMRHEDPALLAFQQYSNTTALAVVPPPLTCFVMCK